MVERFVLLSRLLLLLLPPEIRRNREDEFQAACAACFARESARLGAAGIAYAVLRLTIDACVAAVLIRIDAWRSARIAAAHMPAAPQGDSNMASLWQDVRYAVRTLGRAPGFSAVAILTLAVTIGAITAIFSVVNGVLLRSMPFGDPDRLAILYEAIPKALAGPIGFSAPDYAGFEQRARSFTSLAAFANKEYELSGVTQPERVTAARVSATIFTVLGVQPLIGRAFTRDEDLGRVPVAILSDGLWRRAFGSDASIVGRPVVLDRKAYTVVGVMPPTFVFPNRGPIFNNVPADLFVPISFTEDELAAFGSMYNNTVIGRLAPGVTVAQADAEARAICERMTKEIYPSALQQMGLTLSASVVPLRDEIVGRVQTLLYVLLAAVGVVLLIACADLANLMLTRAAGRQREMAVRTALGAARSRLARQVLVEAGLLAAAGGLLGVPLAYWGTRALVRLAPETLPRLNEIGLDGRVLGFAAVTSILTALLCGVLPAIESSRRLAGQTLKDGGRAGTPGSRQRRMFGTLVIVQFALAVVLLVAGGLLIRSFARLMAVNPGFRPEHVMSLQTNLPAAAYPTGADVRGFYRRLMERIEQLPGVAAAAASTYLPLAVRERRAVTLELQPPESANVPHAVAHDWTIGRYFDALGITLVSGRFLSEKDTPTSEPVVVINEALARRFWPGRDPVGQRIAWGGSRNHGPWMRIVGIVGDVKQGPLNTQTEVQTYQPWEQVGDDSIAENITGALRSMTIIVRGTTDPPSLASALRAQVHDLDPSLPVGHVRMLPDVVSESAGPQRFNTVILGSFAATALLLAALGIGGVLATSVSRRTQEIGVRMALGAQRVDLLRLVIRQGMTLVFIGLVIGAPAAFALSRFMSALLFDISPRDPLTFAAVSALLLSVAMLACYIPARRATRVDPMVALRYE
jgi:predicted permease